MAMIIGKKWWWVGGWVGWFVAFGISDLQQSFMFTSLQEEPHKARI